MTKTLSNSVEQVIYFCLFITVGLFIFIANDATLPLAKILHWQYWVPCMIYSSFVTLFVFGVSQVFENLYAKKINCLKFIRLCRHPTRLEKSVCPYKPDFS
jgi:hypothetical protein